MPVAATSLVASGRRFLRDWPDQDALTASVATTSVATITVADSTKYVVNTALEIEQEAMIVRGLPSGTTVTVQRGAYGTTAATHASGASILLRPEFLTIDYLDALNGAIEATYPAIYKTVLDTSITTTANTWEYAVPNMPGTYSGDSIPIPRLADIDVRLAAGMPFSPIRDWSIRRGASPVIKFRDLPVTGATLRLTGYGPFPDLLSSTSLDTDFPRNATQLLVEMAASRLMASGETARLRNDGGAIDQREAAWRPGSSMNAATQLEGRFLRRLAQVAMPPMKSHVVTHG